MKKRGKKPNQGLTEIRPKHQVPADLSQQAPNNSNSPPTYYEDFEFACVDCGKVERWTAEQQKQVKENGAKLDAANKGKLESAIADLKKAMAGDDAIRRGGKETRRL